MSNPYSKNNHCQCGKLITNEAKRCRFCDNNWKKTNLVGIKNPNWQGGYKKRKSYCIDCGKELNKSAFYANTKRCSSCRTKNFQKTGILKPPLVLKGKNNHNYGKKHNNPNCQCAACKSKRGELSGNNHPSFGKKLSLLVREKISKSHLGKKGLRGILNPMYGKCPTWYRIKYKNINYKSSWESNTAKRLDEIKIKYQYEPKTFDLGNTTYTPDFYLPELNIYLEVKGYWRDSRKKYLKFQRKFRNIFLLNEQRLKKFKIIK